MGIYDVNLKKTNIGYQFDRNVYIGIQTNDNRVVTFKDLGEAIVTSGAGGSGEDIHLTFNNSNVTPSSSPASFVDHVTFLRNNSYVEYDILPQYVRAAEPEETFDYASSTVCLLKAVRAPAEGEGEEEVGDIIGYQLYSSNLPALNINFDGGIQSYSYNGSTAVTINFTSIPTVSTSSLGVTATIPSSASIADDDIPTAGAVRTAIQELAPGIRSLSTHGDGIVSDLSYNSNNNVLTVNKFATLSNAALAWGTAVTYATITTASQATVNYTITLPTVDTIPTVSTSSIEITNTIATNPTGSAIPTDLAVINALERAPGIATVTPTGSGAMVTSITYDRDSHVLSYAKVTASVSGRTITIGDQSTTWTDTNTAGLSWDSSNRAVKASVDNSLATIPTASGLTYGLVTLGTGSTQAAYGNHTHANFTVFDQTYNGATARTVTAGNGITVSNGSVSLHATFNNTTLAWGSPVTYATVAGVAKTLSLPQVTTIPTVSTSSMGITSTISSSSSYIPTSQAVYNALRGQFSYNSSTGVLTIIDA